MSNKIVKHNIEVKLYNLSGKSIIFSIKSDKNKLVYRYTLDSHKNIQKVYIEDHFKDNFINYIFENLPKVKLHNIDEIEHEEN